MYLPVVLFSVLFTTVTPSVVRVESCNATGVSTPIENLEQLLGTIKVLYAYIGNFHIPVPICIDNDISVPNLLEILAYEAVCGKVGEIKLKVEANPLFPGYISQGNNKTYVTSNCIVYEVELSSVDGYVLWNFVGLNVAELTGTDVLSKDELQCVAERVDVMQGSEGSPVCWAL